MNWQVNDSSKLRAFRESLTECYLCPLYSELGKTAGSAKGLAPVVSRGEGRVMFIGMAPSNVEHNTGKPFGEALGETLAELMKKHVGLLIDVDTYMTNLIKCNPYTKPTNMKRGHMRNCSIHLGKELELVDPVIVVFMGKDIFNAIGYADELPGIGVPFQGTLFGKKRWMYVMNNPGVITKSMSQRKSFITQLRNLARWLKEHTTFYQDKGMAPPEFVEYAEPRYVLINTIEKARNMVKWFKRSGAKYMALDTETTGLNLFDPKWYVVGVSLSIDERVGYYLPIGHRSRPSSLIKKDIQQLTKEELKKILEYLLFDLKLIPIFHNYAYDYRVLKKLDIQVDKLDPDNSIWYHDTMILSYLENENDTLGLKDLTFRHFGIQADKFKDVAEHSKFQYVDLEKATAYAAADAVNTLRLFNRARKVVHKESITKTGGKLLERIYPVELKTARIMADAIDLGLAIDLDYLKALRLRLLKEERELYDKLDSFNNIIDHSSTYQLDKLMGSLLDNASRQSYEDQYGWAADEDHLKTLRDFVKKSYESSKFRWTPEKLDDYIKTLLVWRRVNKMLSTYVDALIEKHVVDESGTPIIHGSFKTIGTTSGRMSSQDPNLQNLPREAPKPPKVCQYCGHETVTLVDGSGHETVVNWYDSVDSTGGVFTCAKCGKQTSNYQVDIRRAFVARPNKCFLTCDWDAMELKVAAAVSGDKRLLEIMEGQVREPDNPNYDMHRVTAAGIFGCKPEEVTKEQRQAAKPVGFGCLYLITEVGLANNLRTMAGIEVTVEEAKEWIKNFFDTYPGLLENWIHPGRWKLKTEGYITHPYGRIRRVSRDPSEAEIRSALNFTIQGWCASIMKESLVKIDEAFQGDPGINIVTVIHDEIVVECPIEKAPEVAQVVKEAMNIKIKDKAEVQLTATPEIKFNLSKAAKTYSVEEFEKAFLKK